MEPEDDDMIIDPNRSTHVSCRSCNFQRTGNEVVWQTHGNWKRHLKTPSHLTAVKFRRDTELAARQLATSYRNLYENSRTIQLPVPHAPQPTQVPQLSRPPNEDYADSMGVFLDDFVMTEEEMGVLYPALPSSEEAAAADQNKVDEELELLRQRIWDTLEDELDIETDADHIRELTEELRVFPRTDENLHRQIHGVNASSDYFPYPNKTMCYLDLIDNLPRLRFSGAQFKVILWVMKLLGAQDIPSYNEFRRMQDSLRDAIPVRNEQTISDLGNVFSTVDIRDLTACDFSNPLIAPHLNLYVTDVEKGPISEMWHILTGRWMELPQDLHPPSVLANNRRHYIHELAELDDGRWIIPQMWILQGGVLHADSWLVKPIFSACRKQVLVSVTETWVRIPIDQLRYSHEDLAATYSSIRFDQESQQFAAKIPNCNREIDGGEDLFTIWYGLWSDDVSGARSKQYQKHMNVSGENTCLPGRLLQQEFFVRFLSTSPHAGSLEQFKVILNQIKSTQTNPVRTFNAVTKRPCCFRIFVSDLPGDNPQQSDEASHISHQGNCKCRLCRPGATGVFAASTGYLNFFSAGTPHNVHNIRNCVLEQLRLASEGVKERVDEIQTATGVKDKIALHWISILLAKAKEAQSANPGRCHKAISHDLLEWLKTQTDQPYNPLLDVPFLDPSQDTLIEILHTILLGVNKYGWHNLHANWSKDQQQVFGMRLAAVDINGLNVPPIRAEYLMQYRNNLIGKHFKSLMQVSAFLVYGIADELQFRLIRALGALGAVLWMPEIDNMDEYLEDLTILIQNVLDAFSDIDPGRILKKIKIHILVHLPEQIRRRGPAVRFSTEIFECYNAVFRLCSVLSNHQAASRDISAKMVSLERVKHIISGGYWMKDGEWVHAGCEVRAILATNPFVQKHLGWTPPAEWVAGSVKPVTVKNRAIRTAVDIGFHNMDNLTNLSVPVSSKWVAGSQVMAMSGDECVVGSWAIFRYRVPEGDPLTEQSFIGRIHQIFLPDYALNSISAGLVVVQRFHVTEELHFKLQMPVLVSRTTPVKHIILDSTAIQFALNVQHDCEAAGCAADGTALRRQERIQSSATRTIWVHRNHDRYIVNLHALHNARLIQKYLPRHLTTPRPLYTDRIRRLTKMGQELEESAQKQKEDTNAKRKETLARNKALKEAAAERARTVFEA
ncbi:hypothetical protein VNI00_006746 [Paramarasmius palmivorus]|uniref:Uncharacterized protein n=1 Tax=Paramarasmius palmivorus TaxID=297713 RepID=A0AAW0D8Y4_9AGAR